MGIGNLRGRYPEAQPETWDIEFPITAVEVHEKIGETDFEFGPMETKLPGIRIKNTFISRSPVAIKYG